MTDIAPADVIQTVGLQYAVREGGFSLYELRQFKKGIRVTPFIKQCFVDLLERFNNIDPEIKPITQVKRYIQSGFTRAEREDLIINMVFDQGEVTAGELAVVLNLYRDQVRLDLIRLVKAGVLSVVKNNARYNKTYRIAEVSRS